MTTALLPAHDTAVHQRCASPTCARPTRTKEKR